MFLGSIFANSPLAHDGKVLMVETDLAVRGSIRARLPESCFRVTLHPFRLLNEDMLISAVSGASAPRPRRLNRGDFLCVNEFISLETFVRLNWSKL